MKIHLPNLPLRCATFVTSVLVVTLFAPTGRAGTFTEFVESTALPGSYATITNASTDGSAVAFVANITNTDGSQYQAIYYVGGAGATPAFIANTLTTQSPTGGGVFSDFLGVAVSGSTVVFQGEVQNNQTQNSGIYIAQVGSGGITVAADDNTTNPLDPTGNLTGDSKLDKIYVNFDFQGSNIIFINGANLFATTASAGSAGVVALLPLNPNTPDGVPFASFSSVYLGGNTYVTLGTDANGHNGIYTGNIGGGAETTVADYTTAQPTGSGNFQAFGNPILTSDGSTVVFSGYVNGSNTGLYSAPSGGGTITAVALVGEATPSGGTFPQGAFTDLQTEGDTQVDFSGGGTIYNTAIGGGGVFNTVLASGDSLNGQTVSFAGFQSSHSADFVLVPTVGNGDTDAVYIGSSGGSQYQTPAFFTGEASVGGGVYYLSFPSGNYFGYYSFLADPDYIYHFDLGYEYVFDANDGKQGVYFYDFASSDFFYTSPSFPFPYLYDFGLGATLYYYPDTSSPGRYTSNPRYFYNFATSSIITR
jgi:hypothetical protein